MGGGANYHRPTPTGRQGRAEPAVVRASIDEERIPMSGRSTNLAALAVCVLVLSGAFLTGTSAFAQLIDDVEGYHFIIPNQEAAPGQAVTVSFEGLHEEGVQGFQLVGVYTETAFEISEIHTRDTLIDAIETDFIDVSDHAADGFFTVGVLVDTKPPFDGQVIPNIGRPLPLVYVEGSVKRSARENVEFQLADGLGTPPLSNVYVVDNDSVPVTELSQGFIWVDGVERPVPAFLRGDSNHDQVIDMTDAIAILSYKFLGGPEPECMDAADINDDSAVNMTDSVFLLSFLFNGTRAPPAPMPTVGHDPTPDRLGCENPVDYVLAVP